MEINTPPATQSKTLVLTGATGFIGSHIVEAAQLKGWKVIAWSRPEGNTRDLPATVRVVKTGFGNPDKIAETFRQLREESGDIHYIVHNAGLTKTLRTSEFISVNAGYTRNFTLGIQKAGIRPEKFILMSSLAATGPGDPVSLAPLRPEDPPRPTTRYGQSKRMAEEIVEAVTAFPWNILRPTGVYGPKETDYFLMLKTIRNGLATRAGIAPHHITFLYVDDMVQAVFRALESTVEGRIFHVSDGETYTDISYRDLCMELLNPRAFRLTFPLPIVRMVSYFSELAGNLSGKVPTLNRDKYLTMSALNWKCDITLTRELLGYQPKVLLREGLEKCIGWYRDNGWL